MNPPSPGKRSKRRWRTRSTPLPDYTIEFVGSAAKEFRCLPAVVKRRATATIDALSHNPRPTGCTKLKGHHSLYRVRVGVYRVIYAVDDQARVVHVRRIRHRREVYD